LILRPSFILILTYTGYSQIVIIHADNSHARKACTIMSVYEYVCLSVCLSERWNQNDWN